MYADMFFLSPILINSSRFLVWFGFALGFLGLCFLFANLVSLVYMMHKHTLFQKRNVK